MSIVNGVVTVDGVQQGDLKASPQITVHIQGDVGSVRLEAGTITVEGNVLGDLNTASGDIECRDVAGDVSTISGDVKCGAVGGNVKTMSGDVRHR